MKNHLIVVVFPLFVFSFHSAHAQGPEKEKVKPKPPVWIMKEIEHVGGDQSQRKLKAVHYMSPLTQITTRKGKRVYSVNLDPDKKSDEPMIKLRDPGTGFSEYPSRDQLAP